jgi:murein DD-endopeptidase MepM/ murein hydrolase activator NlpD
MSVIPAALLAAGFLFGAPSVTEARHARRSHAPSTAKRVASGRTHEQKKARHKTTTRAPETARRATRLTLDNAAVERVALETIPLYGPFLPLDAYDYPRPPCTELDAVLEAHMHDANEENPEPGDAAEAVAPAPVNPLARVARTLGSMLRPKSAQSTVRPEDVNLSDLLSAGVQIPVEGVDPSRLQDSFLASRGKYRQHLAIDIGAPKGTPVLAAADGQIVELRREKRGGISLYQKDASGRYLLFYCHLTGYARGLRPGDKVAKGDVIAYVGRTGHVIGGPHLHFSITRLPEDDNFKAGVAVNPYLLFLAAVP